MNLELVIETRIRLFPDFLKYKKSGNYIYVGTGTKNSSLEGGVEQSETVGVRSNTPPDLRSDSPQGENKLSKEVYSYLKNY